MTEAHTQFSRAAKSVRAALMGLTALLVPICHSSLLYDEYTESKWFLLRAATAGLVVSTAWVEDFRWPKLGFGLAAAVLLAAFFTILNPVLQHSFWWATANWLILFDRALFVMLVVVCIQIKDISSRLKTPVALAVILSSAFALFQFTTVVDLKSVNLPDGLGSSFGNANLFAQFLVVSFAILIPTTRFSPSSKLKQGLVMIALACIGILIAVLHCRSAIIGTALIATWYAVSWVHRKFAKMVAVGVVVAMLVVTLGIFALKGADFFAGKAASTADRREIISETIQMIRTVPFGVGVGRYEFDALPFLRAGQFSPSETLLYQTPHNEILRFLAGDGIPWTVLMVSVLVVFLLRKPTSNNHWGERERFLLLGLAFIPEILFQFPFMNADSYFILAVFVALLIINRFEFKTCTPSIRSRIVATIFGFIILFATTLTKIGNIRLAGCPISSKCAG